MPVAASLPSYFWHLLTRLGEAQILLPAALLATLALLRRPDGRPLAGWWFASLAAATLVTAASKVAFVGWGIGSPALNFTGVSGHAMFAAAVYPLLLGTLASKAPRGVQQLGVLGGFALALLIGISRVIVGAHSVSEVVAGLALGGAASAVTLAAARLPSGLVGPVLPAAIALWLMLMPIHAPASNTHRAVRSFALLLSGHGTPYTRAGMLRAERERQQQGNLPPCGIPNCSSSSASPVS
jgi:membrane-associated phospholipid phosphatase